MNFVSFAELTRDVRGLSAQLPSDIRAVVGIPRSGVVAAGMFALHRNIPLLSIAQLADPTLPTSGRTSGNPRIPVQYDGPVLVLDDTYNTGRTFACVVEELATCPHPLTYAAVYRAEQDAPIHTYRRIRQPRVFEWNVFHSQFMPVTVFDMDGVLCENPRQKEGDSGIELDVFLHHLEHAKPLHVPTVPILAIATGRLEKYKSQTEAWLKKHGVKYQILQMSPHKTAASRRAANDSGRMKAAVYKALLQSPLFIESSARQAADIYRLTQRPVLCSDTMTMVSDPFHGGNIHDE